MRRQPLPSIRSEDFFNLGWTFQFDNSYLQTLWMDLPYDTTPYNSDVRSQVASFRTQDFYVRTDVLIVLGVSNLDRSPALL